MSPREDLPVIDDAHLDAIRAEPKVVPDDDWRHQLQTWQSVPPFAKGRYLLPDRVQVGAVEGSLFLFARIVRANVRDFSVGLAFVDDDQHLYRLLRCNGFHPTPHPNVLEDDVIPPETQHLHITTERYLKAKRQRHDGYAVLTQAYDDLAGAIEHLAACVNLVPNDQRMFL